MRGSGWRGLSPSLVVVVEDWTRWEEEEVHCLRVEVAVDRLENMSRPPAETLEGAAVVPLVGAAPSPPQIVAAGTEEVATTAAGMEGA